MAIPTSTARQRHGAHPRAPWAGWRSAASGVEEKTCDAEEGGISWDMTLGDPLRTMRSRTTLAAPAAALCFAACASAASTVGAGAAPPVDTLLMVDTVRVTTESGASARLEDRVARLQIELLGRDVQLEALRRQLDDARQEVVRNMAKLQSQASRAEAASGMAEAEIALQALRGMDGAPDLPELSQAEDLIAQSSSAFGTENYGGALYLATQARSLARSGQGRLGSRGQGSVQGESLFPVPVPLRTVGRSNVRGGPGLTFPVQFTLEGAASVVGHSFTSQWVRVVDEAHREGWIFHMLLTGRVP